MLLSSEAALSDSVSAHVQPSSLWLEKVHDNYGRKQLDHSWHEGAVDLKRHPYAFGPFRVMRGASSLQSRVGVLGVPNTSGPLDRDPTGMHTSLSMALPSLQHTPEWKGLSKTARTPKLAEWVGSRPLDIFSQTGCVTQRLRGQGGQGKGKRRPAGERGADVLGEVHGGEHMRRGS